MFRSLENGKEEIYPFVILLERFVELSDEFNVLGNKIAIFLPQVGDESRMVVETG